MTRFHTMHSRCFTTALAEIRRSRKVSHWMWYIFPQLRGLGRSSTAEYYGLDGLGEAKAFAADPVLSGNLHTITRALLDQPLRNAHAIFGHTDTMKLRSCMTLFELADPDCPPLRTGPGRILRRQPGQPNHTNVGQDFAIITSEFGIYNSPPIV